MNVGVTSQWKTDLSPLSLSLVIPTMTIQRTLWVNMAITKLQSPPTCYIKSTEDFTIPIPFHFPEMGKVIVAPAFTRAAASDNPFCPYSNSDRRERWHSFCQNSRGLDNITILPVKNSANLFKLIPFLFSDELFAISFALTNLERRKLNPHD